MVLLKYEKAVTFATEAHYGQKRKGDGKPYIIHPYTVALILLNEGCSEELVIAGLLHDTVEDTEVTQEDIEKNFGSEVKRLVAGASEPDKSLPWEVRKRHTIEYLKDAPLDIRILTCADKLHNIVSIIREYQVSGERIWDKFHAGKKKQEWYYRNLVEVLCNRDDNPPGITIFEYFKECVENFFDN